MAKVHFSERAARGLIVPPNQTIAARGGAANSYLPLTRHDSAAGLRRFGPPSDHPGSTADFDAPEAPVAFAEQRFDVAKSMMPQPPSAIEPGKGAVPVELCDVRDRNERLGAGLNVSWPPAPARPGPD